MLIRQRDRFPAPRLAPARRGGRATLALKASLQHLVGRPSLFGLPSRLPGLGLGETVYRLPSPPRAGHPFMAALASATAELASREVEVRKATARRLRQELESSGNYLRFPDPLVGGSSSSLRLPVLLSSPVEDQRALRQLGIYKAYPKPLADLPAGIHLVDRDSKPLPGSHELADRLFTMPTHSLVPEDRLISEVRAILGV